MAKRRNAMPDKSLVGVARSPGMQAKIDAKADKVMAGGMKHPKGKLEPVKSDRGDFAFRKQR